ncbi:hypothetical protein C0995_004417, partial [Termitomyces sp. Mi166
MTGAIKFYGARIACKNVTSAAFLYQRAIRKWPRVKTEEEMWSDCVGQWKRIHSNWNKYHPEEVVEPLLGIIDLQEYLKTVD